MCFLRHRLIASRPPGALGPRFYREVGLKYLEFPFTAVTGRLTVPLFSRFDSHRRHHHHHQDYTALLIWCSEALHNTNYE